MWRNIGRYIASAFMIVMLLVLVCIAQAYSNSIEDEGTSINNPKGKVENWITPDEEYLTYYELGTFKSELPIVHINTKNQQITKDTKIWSKLSVTESSKDNPLSIMTLPNYEVDILINYRGASSYSQFDKKQYRIKFTKSEGSLNAKEYSFLGMGSNSEWILNGPFLDKTLMRNRLVYGLAREIFEWAPDTRYVELFIDGKYQGVYLAVEPVTNGESRLRLCEFGLASGETSYIVKRDRVGTEPNPLYVYGYYAGLTNNSLYISYPSSTDLTKAQEEWITKDIDTFEKVLYGDNFADEKNGYAKYIDVDNFIDYFILNEVVMNNDASNLSTYIYKELSGKLKIAVWDYNNCYDNYQWFAQDYDEFFLENNAWFSRLLQDRAFVDKIIERYSELRQGTLSEEYIYGKINEYIQELGGAVERNFKVWGYTFKYVYSSDNNELHYSPTSYEDAISQLKNSIHTRFTHLDECIEDLYVGCIN